MWFQIFQKTWSIGTFIVLIPLAAPFVKATNAQTIFFNFFLHNFFDFQILCVVTWKKEVPPKLYLEFVHMLNTFSCRGLFFVLTVSIIFIMWKSTVFFSGLNFLNCSWANLSSETTGDAAVISSNAWSATCLKNNKKQNWKVVCET